MKHPFLLRLSVVGIAVVCTPFWIATADTAKPSKPSQAAQPPSKKATPPKAKSVAAAKSEPSSKSSSRREVLTTRTVEVEGLKKQIAELEAHFAKQKKAESNWQKKLATQAATVRELGKLIEMQRAESASLAESAMKQQNEEWKAVGNLLKELEATRAMEVTTIEITDEALKKTLAESDTKAEVMQKALQGSETRWNQAKTSLSQIQAELNRVNEERQRLVREKDEINRELVETQFAYENLKRRSVQDSEQFDQQMNTLRKSVNDRNKSLGLAESKITELEADLRSSAEKMKRMGSMTDALAVAKKQAADAATEISKAREEMGKLSATNKSNAAEMKSLTEKLRHSATEKAALDQNLQKTLAELKKAKDLTGKTSVSLAEAQKANTALKKQVDQFSAMEKRLTETANKLAEASSAKASLMSELERTRSELNNEKKGNRALEAMMAERLRALETQDQKLTDAISKLASSGLLPYSEPIETKEGKPMKRPVTPLNLSNADSDVDAKKASNALNKQHEENAKLKARLNEVEAKNATYRKMEADLARRIADLEKKIKTTTPATPASKRDKKATEAKPATAKSVPTEEPAPEAAKSKGKSANEPTATGATMPKAVKAGDAEHQALKQELERQKKTLSDAKKKADDLVGELATKSKAVETIQEKWDQEKAGQKAAMTAQSKTHQAELAKAQKDIADLRKQAETEKARAVAASQSMIPIQKAMAEAKLREGKSVATVVALQAKLKAAIEAHEKCESQAATSAMSLNEEAKTAANLFKALDRERGFHSKAKAELTGNLQRIQMAEKALIAEKAQHANAIKQIADLKKEKAVFAKQATEMKTQQAETAKLKEEVKAATAKHAAISEKLGVSEKNLKAEQEKTVVQSKQLTAEKAKQVETTKLLSSAKSDLEHAMAELVQQKEAIAAAKKMQVDFEKQKGAMTLLTKAAATYKVTEAALRKDLVGRDEMLKTSLAAVESGKAKVTEVEGLLSKKEALLTGANKALEAAKKQAAGYVALKKTADTMKLSLEKQTAEVAKLTASNKAMEQSLTKSKTDLDTKTKALDAKTKALEAGTVKLAATEKSVAELKMKATKMTSDLELAKKQAAELPVLKKAFEAQKVDVEKQRLALTKLTESEKVSQKQVVDLKAASVEMTEVLKLEKTKLVDQGRKLAETQTAYETNLKELGIAKKQAAEYVALKKVADEQKVSLDSQIALVTKLSASDKEMRKTNTDLQVRMKTATASLEEMTKAIETGKQKLLAETKKVTTAEAAMKKADETLAAEKAKVATSTKQLEKVTSDLKALTAEKAKVDAGMVALHEAQKKSVQEVVSLTRSRDEYKAANEAIVAKMESAKKDLTKLEATKKSLTADLEKTNASLVAAKEDAQSKLTELETTRRTLEKTRNDLDRTASDLKQSSAKLVGMAKLKNNFDTMTADFGATSKKLTVLTKQAEEVQREAAVLRKELSVAGPRARAAQMVLYDIEPVYFGTNDTQFDEVQQARVLHQVRHITKIFPQSRFMVSGHTDSRGDEKSNRKLSEGRASNFVDYLVANGLDPQQFEFEGKGEAEPVGDNTIAEGRGLNRRVEVRVIEK